MKKHKVYWERFKRALRVKGGEVTDLVGQKQDALLEPDDPIYHKKIHPDPEPEKGILTRGGIDVREIVPKTMESKICPGLYLAGEIIDVDGYTGGYNLQIAWSTAFLAGNAVAK